MGFYPMGNLNQIPNALLTNQNISQNINIVVIYLTQKEDFNRNVPTSYALSVPCSMAMATELGAQKPTHFAGYKH